MVMPEMKSYSAEESNEPNEIMLAQKTSEGGDK
jgi:hypothetical protein